MKKTNSIALKIGPESDRVPVYHADLIIHREDGSIELDLNASIGTKGEIPLGIIPIEGKIHLSQDGSKTRARLLLTVKSKVKICPQVVPNETLENSNHSSGAW